MEATGRECDPVGGMEESVWGNVPFECHVVRNEGAVPRKSGGFNGVGLHDFEIDGGEASEGERRSRGDRAEAFNGSESETPLHAQEFLANVFLPDDMAPYAGGVGDDGLDDL